MTEEHERLCREIANEGANWHVATYHSHRPIAERIRIYQQLYDSLLAALWAYHSVSGALRVRQIAMASEN